MVWSPGQWENKTGTTGDKLPLKVPVSLCCCLNVKKCFTGAGTQPNPAWGNSLPPKLSISFQWHYSLMALPGIFSLFLNLAVLQKRCLFFVCISCPRIFFSLNHWIAPQTWKTLGYFWISPPQFLGKAYLASSKPFPCLTLWRTRRIGCS